MTEERKQAAARGDGQAENERQRKREVLLRVQDLHVTFGKGKKAFEAVRGVSFDVYRG